MRHGLHVGRRRLRRGGQPLDEGKHHGFDQRVCPAADTQAPTTPTGLNATAKTANSITMAWTASTDNVGVTGYSVYNGSSIAGSTTGTSYTVSGLACGTSYTLAVDAYDAAGNRSTKASIAASTSACAPPADTQAPTTPGGLSATGATATSISLTWTASTDNVGVTAIACTTAVRLPAARPAPPTR